MAKEFDIYLNERLHQCDIIVYSIPYRDGLTVMERLILETCLESYILQKSIAVQSGSVLVSHIDEMIKTCLERLSHGIVIGTSAEFQVHYALHPHEAAIELSTEGTRVSANIFASAETTLQIATPPAFAYVKRPFGRGEFRTEIKSSVDATFKRDLEKAYSQLELYADSLITKKRSSERVSHDVTINTEMTDLLYRLYDTSSMAIEIAAGVAETEIHFSLGRSTMPIVLNDEVAGERMTKLLAMENVVEILSGIVTGTLTQFIQPKYSGVALNSETEVILKRHRLLSEMDADALSAYDDMSFDVLDYVIL